MKKFIFFILIFFISCSAPKPPNWYINTPKDNNLYFYATSSGYSKKEAIKEALNDIASRINIKISSEFVINKGIHNKKTYNEIYQQINTQIKNINFNNYKILKIKKLNEKYYVLVRVNKLKLINYIKLKIKEQLNNINLKTKSPIKKVLLAYKTLKKLKKIKSNVFILESLNYDISEYIQKINSIYKNCINIINNTKFQVVANKYKKASAEIISKFLTLSKHSKNKIIINIKTQKLILFDYYLIKGNASIIIYKPYTLTFLGKSVSSYKEAETFVIKEYKKRLELLFQKITN